MNPVKGTIERLKAFKQNKDDVVLDIVRSIEGLIVAANVEQLEQGKRSDETRITPEYTRLTKIIKLDVGQPIDRVTLKDEGDFHDSIYIKYGKDYFLLTASDSKTIALMVKYQNEILGITNKNLLILEPYFNKGIRNYLTANVL